MTSNQSAMLEAEVFLCENYELRRNVLSGKTEVRSLPKTEIMEYLDSTQVPEYDPILAYLNNLPAWAGEDEVKKLFMRIPGMSEGQRYWFTREEVARIILNSFF